MSTPAHKTLDDFEFGEIIGEGAFGDVLYCREKATGREFAVKKIRKIQLIKTSNIKNALTERDILVKCNHPNIIKLYYAFRDPENLNYILELAPNGDLLKLIKRHNYLDVESVRFYAAELVSALEYLSSMNIVHRDLKPENILLSVDYHLKITDFGTAKILPPERELRSNSFVGTVEYIAPEALEGENQLITPSIDLWALGCIIFHMLTGYSPFHRETQFLTLEAIKKSKIKFTSNFDANAKDFVKRLLVKDPESRIGSRNFNDLKVHPFLKKINWDKLKDTNPPQMALESGNTQRGSRH